MHAHLVFMCFLSHYVWLTCYNLCDGVDPVCMTCLCSELELLVFHLWLVWKLCMWLPLRNVCMIFLPYVMCGNFLDCLHEVCHILMQKKKMLCRKKRLNAACQNPLAPFCLSSLPWLWEHNSKWTLLGLRVLAHQDLVSQGFKCGWCK